MLAALILRAFLPVAFGQAPGAAGGGPPPPNGEQLYLENCVECHGPEGDAVADVDQRCAFVRFDNAASVFY